MLYYQPGQLRQAVRFRSTISGSVGLFCCIDTLESQRGQAITSSDTIRINHQIRAREVRVITDDKQNRIMPLIEALRMAEEKGLDLVEVSPNSDPPVCRIMDYGKFMYEQQRKERKARKQQKTIEVKEIVIQPKTSDHHLQFKMRDARRWMEDGMKVRVRIRFRGREIAHADIGRGRLEKIIAELRDVAVVEQMPTMEGNTMLMVLAPAQEAIKKKPGQSENERGEEV